MIPEEIFKRRRGHNNTPPSTLLILTNFIVFVVDMTLFINKSHVYWFFWVVIGFLALYNFFTVRRNHEEFTKPVIIAYLISILILVPIFFVFKGKP